MFWSPLLLLRGNADGHREVVSPRLAKSDDHWKAQPRAPKGSKGGGRWVHDGVRREVAPDDLAAYRRLTQAQRAERRGDTYRDAGLRKVQVGVDWQGNEVFRYPHTPDLFLTSDATGMPIRHYVRLDSGAVVHPDEFSRLSIGKDGKVAVSAREPLRWSQGGGKAVAARSFHGALEDAVFTLHSAKRAPTEHHPGPDWDAKNWREVPITIASTASGLSATRTRAEWERVYRRYADRKERAPSFAQWVDEAGEELLGAALAVVKGDRWSAARLLTKSDDHWRSQPRDDAGRWSPGPAWRVEGRVGDRPAIRRRPTDHPAVGIIERNHAPNSLNGYRGKTLRGFAYTPPDGDAWDVVEYLFEIGANEVRLPIGGGLPVADDRAAEALTERLAIAHADGGEDAAARIAGAHVVPPGWVRPVRPAPPPVPEPAAAPDDDEEEDEEFWAKSDDHWKAQPRAPKGGKGGGRWVEVAGSDRTAEHMRHNPRLGDLVRRKDGGVVHLLGFDLDDTGKDVRIRASVPGEGFKRIGLGEWGALLETGTPDAFPGVGDGRDYLSKRVAAQSGDLAPPRHVAPQGFKSYDDGANDWEVDEEQYIKRRHRLAHATAERNVEGFYREYGQLRPNQQKRAREVARGIQYWDGEAKRLLEGDITDREREGYRADYIATTKKAISSGKDVPEIVIAQRPEFKAGRTARQRYDKGRHTSFANESAAVDRSIQGERGYKVKRQDGKPIAASQIAEIDRGMREIEEVTGPLVDALRASDLTIAHTSGKHPFLSGAGGLFHAEDRTITIGVELAVPGLTVPVRAQAHEIAHWLDAEAGRARAIEVDTPYGSAGRRTYYKTTFLSEFDSRAGFGLRGQGQRSAEEMAESSAAAALLRDARASMRDSYKVRRLLGKKKSDATTPEEQVEIEEAKVALTSYYQDPREVFARLFEQYVHTKRGKSGVSHDDNYTDQAAYWRPEDFARLMPGVEREIKRRVAALGLDPARVGVPHAPPDEVKPKARATRKKTVAAPAAGVATPPAAPVPALDQPTPVAEVTSTFTVAPRPTWESARRELLADLPTPEPKIVPIEGGVMHARGARWSFSHIKGMWRFEASYDADGKRVHRSPNGGEFPARFLEDWDRRAVEWVAEQRESEARWQAQRSAPNPPTITAAVGGAPAEAGAKWWVRDGIRSAGYDARGKLVWQGQNRSAPTDEDLANWEGHVRAFLASRPKRARKGAA